MKELQKLLSEVKESIPALSDLSETALSQLIKTAVFQRLVRKTDFELQVAGIDMNKELRLFLDTKKTSTRNTYLNTFRELNSYAGSIKKRLFEFTYRDADNYVYYLKGKGYSNASICLWISAASGFCGFLERRYFGGFSDGLGLCFKNPFRGIGIRPKPFPLTPLEVPHEQEIQVILRKFPARLVPVVAILALQGLRCDALSTLVFEGERFTCISKGKTLMGKVSPELAGFLAGHQGLLKNYRYMSKGALKCSIRHYMGKLFEQGELRAIYSCHDFRHYFAVKEYRKDKDIWRVSKLLGHNSLAATEHYLRSLGQLTR
jgi:integrase